MATVKASNIPFSSHASTVDPLSVTQRIFRERGDQRYSLELLPARITFEVDRLRRSSQELWGEVAVTVDPSIMPSARTIDGVLSVGDMNFSSVAARGTRAKFFAERSGMSSLDWVGYMEEFCVKVVNAERAGAPDLDLREVAKPEPDRMFTVDGVEIPLRHPMILFGDGGSAKSYLSLYWAGKMVQAGHQVLYADWEFTPEEHRERLEYLFGPVFPSIRYMSCFRSFREEVERLKRVIALRKITYLICDSVGIACGGDPSTAESATTYFQALRGLGSIGSLHIAHVTKSTMKGEDSKPFGSAFWHNMARVTLNAKGEELPNGDLAVALYPRKRNLKGRGVATAYTLTFGDTSTTIKPSDVKDHAVLAESLPVSERLLDVLKIGSKTRKELAELLDVDYGLLQRTVYREIKRGRIVEMGGVKKGSQRIALAGPKVSGTSEEF